ILWPAMLMSAGLQVPKSVYVHPFINSDGQKMSKSLGNVINPFEIIEKYGVDPVRYFLLRYIPSNNDGDFNNDRFEEAYNADLANNLGNLVSRTAAMLVKYNDGQFDEVKVNSQTQLEDYISHCQFDKYLEEVFAHLDSLNGAIEENKPWELAKSDLSKAIEFLSGLACELTMMAEYLVPFMPDTSEKILMTFAHGKVNTEVGILFPRIDS
nr:class I tRNA ligase family protein [Candidatus Saccharibacteria bacterium]